MSEEMGAREIIAEWHRGCSCATPGKPEECLSCTRGALEAIAAIPEYSTSRRELRARSEIVLRIIRAKRDTDFPLSSNFFDDVWPQALAALRHVRALGLTYDKETKEWK